MSNLESVLMIVLYILINVANFKIDNIETTKKNIKTNLNILLLMVYI